MIGARHNRGSLLIEWPDGRTGRVDGDEAGPRAHLIVHRLSLLARLAAAGDVGFAEGYIRGDWSSPNLTALLGFFAVNYAARKPRRRLPAPFGLLRHAINRNTRRGSRRNIAAHYDLGNSFYKQWLDQGMNYSSALYVAPDQTLEAAQQEKLLRVEKMLALSGGETVLEIGCGWGALAEHLITRHAARMTAITLSARQLEFTRARLSAGGLAGHADLRLQDYRDVDGEYDRVVSIEMLEAVGLAYWPVYFKKLWDRLRPGGIAAIQVITIAAERFENYRSNPDFIQRYIFPGGMLPTAEIVLEEAAKAGLECIAAEHFGESYARTLQAWNDRFQRAWPAIAKSGFDTRFKRTWEYYLAYCQAGFEAGIVDVGLYRLQKPGALKPVAGGRGSTRQD